MLFVLSFPTLGQAEEVSPLDIFGAILGGMSGQNPTKTQGKGQRVIVDNNNQQKEAYSNWYRSNRPWEERWILLNCENKTLYCTLENNQLQKKQVVVHFSKVNDYLKNPSTAPVNGSSFLMNASQMDLLRRWQSMTLVCKGEEVKLINCYQNTGRCIIETNKWRNRVEVSFTEILLMRSIPR